VQAGGKRLLIGGDRGAGPAAQGAGCGGLSAERGGGAGADELGGGQPDRRTGPLVRFPAPLIVVLSSPNVVSDALHPVR